MEGGLQDPALFLAREAAMAGEELVYEVEEGEETAPGLLPTSVRLQLTYFESTVTVEEKTEASAVAKAAVKTLQQAGPWMKEEDLDQVSHKFETFPTSFQTHFNSQVTSSIKAALPMAFMSWLPPLYNAEHVSTTDPNTGAAWVGEVPGRSLYRASCLLGPITVQVKSVIVLVF